MHPMHFHDTITMHHSIAPWLGQLTFFSCRRMNLAGTLHPQWVPDFLSLPQVVRASALTLGWRW